MTDEKNPDVEEIKIRLGDEIDNEIPVDEYIPGDPETFFRGPVFPTVSSRQSFPSGHTTVAFAVAVDQIRTPDDCPKLESTVYTGADVTDFW